jgi:ABC-2 type transport system ATP-binding protein
VLQSLPGVLSVAQVGNALRILAADDSDMAANITDALARNNLPARVEAVTPNLEDVFVAVTRDRDDATPQPRERAA